MLHWLKEHNPLYEHVEIDHTILIQNPDNIVPRFIPYNPPEDETDSNDCSSLSENQHATGTTDDQHLQDVHTCILAPDAADNVGTDIEISENFIRSVHQQRAKRDKQFDDTEEAAVPSQLAPSFDNVLNTGKATSRILNYPDRGPLFCDFTTPNIMELIFPNLFQYGRGGFFDVMRRRSEKRMDLVRHLLSLADERFVHCPQFILWAVNFCQRRQIEGIVHTAVSHDGSSSENTHESLSSVPVPPHDDSVDSMFVDTDNDSPQSTSQSTEHLLNDDNFTIPIYIQHQKP